MTHSYGYIPDKPDIRDYKYQMPAMHLAALPSSVDLKAFCSPVRDQGQLGSCTGFAMGVGLREFMDLKYTKTPFVQLSPMFLYYYERSLENTTNQDAGAEMRDGMKVLATKGISPEKDWPYVVPKFKKAPTKTAQNHARKYKIGAYARLTTLQQLKSCLAGGNGVAIGFLVYESFESDVVFRTGYMPMPKTGEQILGGHAVFVMGYRDDVTAPGGGWLKVKNSWGTGWGDRGYFYMPYLFVIPTLVSDMWTAAL